MKSYEEIYDDVYAHLKGSALEQEVTGILTDKRPAKSTKEDIVIEILSTNFDEIQTAYIYVNVYVKDKQVNGQWQRDKKRLRTLGKISEEVLKLGGVGKDFSFTIESQMVNESYNDNEHKIQTQILYKHYNP